MIWVSWRQDAKWEPVADWGLWALSNPQLSNPAKMRKKCRYGHKKNLGQITIRSCFHSPLTHKKHHPFENKVWEIYFNKEVYSLPVDCSRVYLYMYVAIQYSRLYLVSIQSCCWWALVGWPTLACPCKGVHCRILLMSSSLLLQQCPVYLPCLI